MGMRLKDLRINQVPFWYQIYDGQEDELDENGDKTGDKIPKYSKPVRAWARISPNTGDAENSPFGKEISYDKTISTVKNLPIDEYTKLFIDIVPVLNADGTTNTEPDYRCVCPKSDLHQNVWAVKRIDGSGHGRENQNQLS